MSKELPKDAIIIDGEIYVLEEVKPKMNDCETCDLRENCKFMECLCMSIFGEEKADGKNLKKLKQ